MDLQDTSLYISVPRYLAIRMHALSQDAKVG